MLEPFSTEQRATALRKMAAEGVDVLVIGGGITGAGVALDAAARGLRVGLVDKSDFAAGTTSKSTKLVHGGIRYLPQFDFGLVHEALVERGLLIRNAPFLVKPLPFVLPLYSDARRPLGTPIVPPFGVGMGVMLQAGLLLYDLMSGRLSIRRHRRITLAGAARAIPCLEPDKLIDAFIFYDAQTDDTRLTMAVLRTAMRHGALQANYAEVVAFEHEGGRISAARIEDRLGGESLRVPCGTVVNAAGVFAGRVQELAGGPATIQVRPAKGVHLTVPRAALKMRNHALVLPETEDGRILFIVPWGPRVTIGTTDTPGGDIEHPVADKSDVQYLLRHVNQYMRCGLTEADIISSWAGYRPLVSARRGTTVSSKLSRTHAVIDGPSGMLTIIGGKLTTYRRMAQDTVDHISRRYGRRISHPTRRLPLDGSHSWPEVAERIEETGRRYGLRPDTLRRLATYGANALCILDMTAAEPALATRLVPDLPYIMAEALYAARYEMAATLQDVLTRRLHVNFEDWSRGLSAAPAVARLMARELGWDEEETARQIREYAESVKSHG